MSAFILALNRQGVTFFVRLASAPSEVNLSLVPFIAGFFKLGLGGLGCGMHIAL